MSDISLHDLLQRNELIGKPIKEHGVDVERPFTRFHIEDNFFRIFVVGDNGTEESIGGGHVDFIHAEIEGDGNICISGPYCPTFVLYPNG